MFVTIFAETPLCLNVHRVLVDVPTSSRVVKGRAGIWRRRWSLVPYPVNAAGRLLDPLAEVNIKRAGEIAGCWGSWIWCRKESRVLKVRVCKPFPSVPQGTPISLPRLRPGDDGQPNAIHPGYCTAFIAQGFFLSPSISSGSPSLLLSTSTGATLLSLSGGMGLSPGLNITNDFPQLESLSN